MKRTNLAKKLTAMAMTGVMVMSMGMTAFAAEADGVKSIDVKKTVTTDGNTYAPNTTFTFTITEGAAERVNEKTVYAGVEDGLTMSQGITFAPNGEAETAEEYIQSGAITVNADKFTTPGIYHYVVSEDTGTYEGITYDTKTYDLYVYVENVEGGIKVAGVTASIPEGEGSPEKATEIAFTNDYGNDMVHSVLITKEVTGNQGDKTKEFSFSLSVDGDAGELYKVVHTDQKDGTTVSYLTSDAAAAPYTLKHGESLQIFGLSASDTYTVTETDYSGDGYTTTVNDEATNTNNGTTANGDVTVAFENSKNVTTPTGIAMTFAPYVVMVVFAGVFAVMFLRKKREDF